VRGEQENRENKRVEGSTGREGTRTLKPEGRVRFPVIPGFGRVAEASGARPIEY